MTAELELLRAPLAAAGLGLGVALESEARARPAGRAEAAAAAAMIPSLGLSAPGLQWVVNAYAIAFAGFMLLGGRAGDLYGRKRMFLVGLTLFTLASLAGGLAQQDWQLLLARAVQGLGAAVLAPSTLTIVTSTVPEGAARARAIATWTAVGAGG
ncbi:MFS transporter, partial [Streptomyces sp. NPDC005568]|uniref:MFS transporter n=1 Tax=Streptomyces sp. NPDC005568 TaxID=3156887 RepID=UPI0033A37F26